MIETRVAAVAPPATGTGAEEIATDTDAEETTFESLYRTHAKRIYSLAYPKFNSGITKLLENQQFTPARMLEWHYKRVQTGKWVGQMMVLRTPPGCGSMPSAS